MKTSRGARAVLFGVAVCIAWGWWAAGRATVADDPSAREEAAEVSSDVAPEDAAGRIPYEMVPVNQDVPVAEGFRGGMHPLLHGQGPLELTAHWAPVAFADPSGGVMDRAVDGPSPGAYRLSAEVLNKLRYPVINRRRRAYGPAAFSALLPVEIERVGQVWSIDETKAATFLEQFSPSVSTAFSSYEQSYGRRPGPRGAFGVLRAISPTHLEIVFRVHAEFMLQPTLVYTPAAFLGRMLLNRADGTIEFFQMRVPTERAINLTLNINGRHPGSGEPWTTLRFERVTKMDLHGGARAVPSVAWTEELALEGAHAKLRGLFYKFLDIDWVPVEDVLRVAKARARPVFAVVLTSPLTDQSC